MAQTYDRHDALMVLANLTRSERVQLMREADALGEPCDVSGCDERPTRSIRFVETAGGKTVSHGGMVRCDTHLAELNTRPVNERVRDAQRKRFTRRGHSVDVRIRNS